VESSLTSRDVLRVLWPHAVFLASAVALFASAALGAPQVLTLPLAVVAGGVFPLAAYLHLRETRNRRAALGSVAGDLARGAFLVGFAFSALLTVLFVAGGLYDGIFHDEDVVLLAVCWGALALIWLAGRYVPPMVRRRTGDA
jgi:hypothetical protein